MSAGADRKANAKGRRLTAGVVICVSLRMAASAEAPSSPMSLLPILQARGRMGTVRE